MFYCLFYFSYHCYSDYSELYCMYACYVLFNEYSNTQILKSIMDVTYCFTCRTFCSVVYKSGEPIEVPFGQTRVGPGNHVLDVVTPTDATWGIRMIDLCAAAMAQILKDGSLVSITLNHNKTNEKRMSNMDEMRNRRRNLIGLYSVRFCEKHNAICYVSSCRQTDRQTDRQTPQRCIDPAPYTWCSSKKEPIFFCLHLF